MYHKMSTCLSEQRGAAYTITVMKATECPKTNVVSDITLRPSLFYRRYYSQQTGAAVANYRGVDMSLVRSTSRCILFDGENISFDTSLVTYSTSIPPHCAISRTVPGSIPGGVTRGGFRGSPRRNHVPWGRLRLWK